MRSLADQFLDKIKPRLDQNTLAGKVAQPMAERVAQRMKQNSMAGTTFPNQSYKPNYSSRRRKERKALGLQVSRVDLRAKKKRIENTQVNTVGNAAKVTFADTGFASVFRDHHEGRNKLPVRSLFPKTPEAIPKDIFEQMKKTLTQVLRGQ